MPQVPGAKTGFDYGRLKNHIQATGAQKDNSALFQTLNELGDAARTFQGFIEQQFPQLDGSLNSLYAFITGVIQELNEVRNNSKYSLSLTNSEAISVPPGVEQPLTFDTVIFDDGLQQYSPSEIKLISNGQWFISGRVTYCTPLKTYCKVTVNINDVPQFSSAIQVEGKAILPFGGLIEALRNDIITVTVFQDGVMDVDIAPSVQMFRVTYVTHGKNVGRNLPDILDSEICGSDGDTTGCTCEDNFLGLIVVPEAERTYLLNPSAQVYKQSNDTIAVTPVNQVICMIGLRNGLLLRLRDNNGTGKSRLEFVDPETLLVFRTVELTELFGCINGAHCLLELPCGHILTVKRSNGAIYELDSFDGSVQRIIGLVAPSFNDNFIFDGAVNKKGNRLLYTDNTDGDNGTLKCWDLINDVELCTIGAFAPFGDYDEGYIFWPIWVNDCTVLLAQGNIGFLHDNDIIKIDLDGNILKRITYDHSTFEEGLYGIAANKSLNRLWVVGDWDNRSGGFPHYDEEPATLIFNLKTGLQIGNVVPFAIPNIKDSSDGYASVTQAYFSVPCTACDEIVDCGGGSLVGDGSGDGGGGDPGCVHCDPADTPANASGPGWYQALTGALSTTCFTTNDLAGMVSTFNTNGFTIQNQDRGNFRPRAYNGFPVPNFAEYVDLTAGCAWTWVQHGF